MQYKFDHKHVHIVLTSAHLLQFAWRVLPSAWHDAHSKRAVVRIHVGADGSSQQAAQTDLEKVAVDDLSSGSLVNNCLWCFARIDTFKVVKDGNLLSFADNAMLGNIISMIVNIGLCHV